MRLPFVSRRVAEETLCLLVEVSRRAVTDAEDARSEAEHRLAVERAKWRRAVGYAGNGQRLARALRALAVERAQSAAYRRTIRALTDQLLDATGYQGEPLLPAAREALGIDTLKEDQ